MATKKSSESRRKSMAAMNQNKPPLPRTKRRHSIVPGDRLSPRFKARHSLAPRKSILKGSLNIPSPDDIHPDSESYPASQSQSQLQIAHTDDASIVTSTDLTRDFTTTIHDNTSRKSLGRRVSFAAHAKVKLFKVHRQKGNTGSAPSQSSPPGGDGAGTSTNERSTHTVHDENAYPGAASIKHRRSSTRRSVGFDGEGEESMDLDMNDTARGPSAFLLASEASGSAIQDEDDDGDDEDDMEITEAIAQNIHHRRSLATNRRPLSIIPTTTPSNQQQHYTCDQSQDSYTDDNSTRSSMDTDSSNGQPVEYTIPLTKSLRIPGPPDELWLALRKMTHSGDTPIEPVISSDDEGYEQGGENGMDLDHAVQRLMDARSPLPLDENRHDIDALDNDGRDDSFSSMDNSVGEIGDETVNVSKMFRKASIGGQSEPNSTMEATGIYGGVLGLPESPISTRPEVQSQQTPATSKPNFQPLPSSKVFQPQSKASTSAPATKIPPPQGRQATVPKPFSFAFTPKSTSTAPPTPQPALPSPSKAKSLSKPDPVQRPQTQTPSAASAIPVARVSPKKRAASSDKSDVEDPDSTDRPSPAKRMAMAGKWTATTSSIVPARVEAPVTTKPKPLSPSKKAPFQPSQVKPSSKSLRRPSGYFARRKSMGVGLSTDAVGKPSSPTKKAVMRFGRLSVGGESSATTEDWTRIQERWKGNANGETDKGLPIIQTRGLPKPSSPKLGSPALAHDSLNDQVGDPFQHPASHEVFEEQENTSVENGVMAMDMDATEQWREGIMGQDFAEEDEGPPISIEQFFTMTGIRFMDEITAPRRSTHPSQLQSASQNRRTSSAEISLTEYIVAIAVDIPQLKLYTRVSKDLEAWVEQRKAVYEQAEEEAAKLTPELFREYSQANEEGREQLLHQLHLMKANSRGLAKSEWYDWKLSWINGLHSVADKGFADLEADAKILEDINKRALQILPALEEEYQEVTRELEQEQSDVAEIESGDKEYLNELKASIAEQNHEVEALRSEVAEKNSQLEWLKERLEDVVSQKRETTVAIAEAKRLIHIQKNSTSAEVFRLKDRLETLENLQMFRVTKVNAELFEFVYASQFVVSLPCIKFRPIVKNVDIWSVDTTKSKFKDAYPHLSEFLLRTARQQIAQGKEQTVAQVAQRLGNYWSSCSQIRSQLTLLAIKYPLSIELTLPTPDGNLGFKAKVDVLFPDTKGKAIIAFFFDHDTFSRWPLTIDAVRCEVEIAYGSIDRESVYNAVHGRLAEASAAENHACLLDACIVAMDEFH